MSVKEKIIAINNLLSDIYQKPMRLSHLLLIANFDPDDIRLIRDRLLTETINSFIQSLQATMFDCHDGQRLFAILYCVYGLDGTTPQTLQYIGDELKISRERVRQLKQKALKKLKATPNKSKLQDSFKAKTILLMHHKIGNNNWLTKERTTKALTPQTEPIFSLHQSIEGTKYIRIFSDRTNDSIVITEDNLQTFCDRLIQTANLLQWQLNLNTFRNYGIDNDKKYQRAYEKWTVEEEKVLISKFEQGSNIQEIAAILERQPGAINSRLQKLGFK